MASSESPLMAGEAEGPKTWPILQPDMPRKARYFLCGPGCGGCCPPYIVFAVLGALVLYMIGFSVLFGVFTLVLALYSCFGCPLIGFYLYTAFWRCPPVGWMTGLYVKLTYLGYQSLLLSRKTPTGKNDMPIDKMRQKEELAKSQIEYALNIEVPKGTAEEFTELSITQNAVVQMLEESFSVFPMVDSYDNFAEGEDPVAFVMRQLGSVYPSVYQVWHDKQSDNALSRLCLHGLGAHRVEAVCEQGRKMYVVRTNALSGLPMRDGFERYGGDAYFDTNWNPVMIVDDGLEPANLDGSFNPVITKPLDENWNRAKFRFRSSLSVLVTVVDHLYGLHLQTANLFVTALREQFSADHPLRRFFTPFTFQTISVNDNARNNLVQKRSVGPRCFGLTDAGMQLAFSAAPALLRTGLEVSKAEGGPIVDREQYVKYLNKKGVDTEYFRQSVELYKILKKFLQTYLEYYYATPKDLMEDQEIRNFVAQFTHQLAFVTPGEVVGNHDLPNAFAHVEGGPSGGLNCAGGASPTAKKAPPQEPKVFFEQLLSSLASVMFLVTAGHEQVGAVEAYVQDVAWCAFKWTPGAVCGTKQTATAQALLMSFTSTPMPKLLGDDWTHLFPAPQKPPKAGVKTASQAFTIFQEELLAMSKKCDAYNDSADTRKFPENYPMYTLNPKLLETAISV